MPVWVSLIVALIGAFLGSGFLQFLITRSDRKKERAEEREEKNIKEDMIETVREENNVWKEKYCDVNAQMVADLDTRLAAREREGFEHYQELRDDVHEIKKSIEPINTMGIYMTDALKSLIHDKIIFLGKT
jgi:spore coat polysaccharide biosynthesis protein SpsF (cytidylyltransferase family)